MTEDDFKAGFKYGIKMFEKFVQGASSGYIETRLLKNMIAKLQSDKWDAYLDRAIKKRKEEQEVKT